MGHPKFQIQMPDVSYKEGSTAQDFTENTNIINVNNIAIELKSDFRTSVSLTPPEAACEPSAS